MPEQQLTLPAWFGDHMLLQQKVRTRIYGNCLPGANVTLTLERFPSGEMLSSGDTEYGIIFQESDHSEEDGFFEFKLPFIEASFDPFRLTIESQNERLVFNDILFGEVWIAAGGSNMSMPAQMTDMKPLLEEISRQKGLRFYMQNESGLAPGNQMYSPKPLGRAFGGHWFLPNEMPKLAKVSAVALSFAYDLIRELRIPIAVYDLACPQSCIHSWLPGQVVEQDAIIKNHVREIKHYRDAEHWNELPPEERKEERFIRKNVENKDAAAQPPAFSRHNQQGALFNHKLAPYTSLAARGVLWFQGEEDVQYPDYYIRAFTALSAVMKELFQSPVSGLKLIYAQLQPHMCSQTDFMRLALFNEALAVARHRLSLRAGLVTTYDLPLHFRPESGPYGTYVTPTAKREIGSRMMRVALGLAYMYDLPTSAPEIISAEPVGNKLLLSFDNAGKGIRLRNGHTQLKGFTICDETRQHILAEAKALYNVRVIVWHDEIKEPVSCSYGFYTFNMDANLCGSSGMPLVPFRLERETAAQEKPRHWADCDSLEGFKIPVYEPKGLRAAGKSVPGIYPLWQLISGRASFRLEPDNKRHGTASLMLKYSKADERPLSFGPVLDYASDYPPLDLHLWEEMVLHLFNTEHRVKVLRLKLADANGRETVSDARTIEDILSWQDIHFELKNAPVDLMRLTKLEFILQDPDAEGSLYIDEIEWRGLNI